MRHVKRLRLKLEAGLSRLVHGSDQPALVYISLIVVLVFYLIMPKISKYFISNMYSDRIFKHISVIS